MAQRKPTLVRSKSALPPQLAAVNRHAAGLDVGAEAHDGAVPPSDDPQPVRGVGAYTVDLIAMADGLALCRLTPVALASTGGSWLPLCELWESRGFEGLLVDPPQVRKIRGRPNSAGHDGQWRPRLQTFGLLASAFRPPDAGCLLRRDRRPRARLLTDAGPPIQPRPKALTPMHLTLQHVVSDLPGETGMAIMRAILAGERDPVPLAHLRHDRGQHGEDTLAKARHGPWREEPLCAVAQAVALDDLDHQQVSAGDRQIAAHLATFAERSASEAVPPVWRPRKRTRHRPRVDVRGAWHRMTGVDLTAMAGIDEPTALTLSSEIGLDMGRWPTVKPCTSWRGRCPHHQVSGGTVLSQSTTPWANRAATALRLAASCRHRRQSALGAFFRRMKARLGTPKAITATAHTLARLLYMLLKHGTAYVRQKMADDERHDHNRMVQNLTRRAKVFG